MAFPLLIPLAGMAARALAGEAVKSGIEQLKGGDKPEDQPKSDEKKPSALSTDANF